MINNINKNVLRFINEINSLGYEAFIIGGAPRDLLLGVEVSDYDVCSNIDENEISKRFNVIRENALFLNYVIDYDGEIIELTLFRKDTYSKNRFPRVEKQESIEFDIKRRDFTINCIYIDKDSNYFYPLTSKEDLMSKTIRTIKDANVSFNEDPLRMIRAIYYASKLGFTLCEEVECAIEKNNYLLDKLSSRRIKNELKKFESFDYEKINILFNKYLVKYK